MPWHLLYMCRLSQSSTCVQTRLLVGGITMLAEPIRNDLITLYKSLTSSLQRAEQNIAQYKYDFLKPLMKNITSCREGMLREADNLNHPFRLGVVGMFKAGKSSVLNTLLQRKLLEVGRPETTTVITEMWYLEDHENDYGEVVWSDGTSQKMSLDEALAYTNYYSDVFERHGDDEAKRQEQERIKCVRLYLNCDLLRNVVLIDTPGFGGSDVGDEKALQALENVDAAIMVFTAGRAGTEQEVEIADRLVQNGREIVALLNQIDDQNGNVRDEESIREVESFIAKHFTTVVKDKNGVPLIFLYSAKQILRCLHGDLSTADEETRISMLRQFGYLPSSADGPGQGIIQFVRARYFTSESGVMKSKLDGARITALNLLDGMLAEIETSVSETTLQKDEAGRCIAENERQLHEDVDERFLRIEDKLTDEVDTLVGQYTRDAVASVSAVIDSFSGMGISGVQYLFTGKGKLEQEAQRRFRSDFPESRDRRLEEDISRRCERILKNEWRSLARMVEKTGIEINPISIDGVMAGVSDALQDEVNSRVAQAIGLTMLVFIPGGVLGDIILSLLSTKGIKSSRSTVEAQIEVAKMRAAHRLRNSSYGIVKTVNSALASTNRKIRDEVESRLLKEADEYKRKHAELTRLEGQLQALAELTRADIEQVSQYAK